jgi:uncharacterized protein (DUF1501 family)
MCNHYHPLSTDTPKFLDAAFTRRRFLGGMAMLSAAASVPGFVGSTSEAYADTNWYTTSKPGVPEDRVLVVVQLSGGNDGLNTVVPFASDAYHKARPGIRINDAIRFDGNAAADGIGLNPALRPIHEMIGQGRAAIVNGVGYPNPNRSHFKSMDIWHSAKTDEKDQRGKGWVGKAMDAAYPLDTNGQAPEKAAMACVSIGNDAPMAVQGTHVQPVAFQNANAFRWAGHGVHDVVSKTYDRINDNAAYTESADPLAFVQRTTLDAQVASARVRQAVQGQTDTRFPASPLSLQLQMVAKMIRAELPTRVYYVTLGGFDTHAQQTNKHTQLLTQFAEALRAFYDELHQSGHDGRVVSLAFSEFGRRLRQNGSGGTDHGVAGPSFVFGPAVKPGLHGSYPSLDRLDQGDLVHTVDFRSVYADVLDNWMAIDSRKTLGERYDHLGLFAKGKRA